MLRNSLFDKHKILILSFRFILAVTIVLLVSLSLDIYKPMWAITAALFLQLRPEAGFVIEKAVCLIGATLIGLIVGCLIVNFLTGHLLLTILALAGFLTICSLVSAGINHSNFIYGVALGNITAILIVLYSIVDPQHTTETQIFHIAYARFIEISIGAISACLSSFLIFPRTVENTCNIHSDTVFDATIKSLITLTDRTSKKFCVNIATKEILDSVIAIHNDSSAHIYEKLDSRNNYIIFSNKALNMLKLIKDYCRNTDFSENFIQSANTLNKLLKSIDKNNDPKATIKTLRASLNVDTPLAIRNITIAVIKLLLSYINIENYKKLIINLKPYRIKNYYNPAIILTTTIRNISIFLITTTMWTYSPKSIGLLLSIIIMTLLSQLFAGVPRSIVLVKNIIAGFLVSVPIAILIKLAILSIATNNFALLLLLFCGSLIIGIIGLTIPKLQMYGLGYCLGFIFIIQPDNHMSFDIMQSLSVCSGLIMGGIIFYIVFRLLPNAPNVLTQRLAVNSLYSDLKKVGKTIYYRKEFAAIVAKKVLCVYKYEIYDNPKSQANIKKAHRLLEIANRHLKD